MWLISISLWKLWNWQHCHHTIYQKNNAVEVPLPQKIDETLYSTENSRSYCAAYVFSSTDFQQYFFPCQISCIHFGIKTIQANRVFLQRLILSCNNRVISEITHWTLFHVKGVLHPWALFLKTLCIFSKNKATLDKVSYGSGQKCSKELKNHSFTSVEAIVVKLQSKMCENQYFPCFEL